ncbi:MAG: hypothetical protein E6R09_06615 [Rhodocyclaceae bacterium]|nr:MAG: hypothetical protein E6R09_06615 [Rhodocyclaceae bacterium]
MDDAVRKVEERDRAAAVTHFAQQVEFLRELFLPTIRVRGEQIDRIHTQRLIRKAIRSCADLRTGRPCETNRVGGDLDR